MVRSVVQGEVEKEVRKLKRTMDALQVKNVALKAKVANLQATVNIEKAKRKRGKAFIVRLCEEDKVKAMFYSPSKIQAARQRLQEEQQEKDAAEAQREEEKRRKQQAKEEQQLLVAQRKAAREEARVQRETDKFQKQQRQKEVTEQRKLNKQLTAEARKVKQDQKIDRARSKLQPKNIDVVNTSDHEEGVQIRSSRFGRQIKPFKHFCK